MQDTASLDDSDLGDFARERETIISRERDWLANSFKPLTRVWKLHEIVANWLIDFEALMTLTAIYFFWYFKFCSDY